MNLNEKLKYYSLSKKEYLKMKSLLKNEKITDMHFALFSSLWSEHCSYKSSKKHLKKLQLKHSKILSSFNENAGVFDLGKKEKIAFKMESHNHPSFIEPFQGAATGVGGIIRDIFAMGAKPVMLSNYLCFSKLDHPYMKHLFENVIAGISHYGNCVGIPMGSGKTQFHNSYEKNILVNAFCLGYFSSKRALKTSSSFKKRDLIFYAGSFTGKDGVRGASMASGSFSGSEKSKTTVQIGDPFMEKLLIEASLEVISLNLVSACQDMGAAGLTSSLFEMSSKAKLGFDIDLSKVPLRDSSMSAEEMMLSESQERMVFSVSPKNEKKFKEVFKKWDLEACAIGEVTDGKKINLYWKKKKLLSIDPSLITENVPMNNFPYSLVKKTVKSLKSVSYEIKELKKTFLKMIKTEAFRDKKWIYRQFDQRVGAKTVYDCSEPIGACLLEESKRLIGLSLSGDSFLMNLHSYLGAIDSFYRSCLNLAIKNFKALCATDCLNFGNPEKKKVMSDFVTSIHALRDISSILDCPIISGNVSFYNETKTKNIAPTPAIGICGIKENTKDLILSKFRENQVIYLVSYKAVRHSGEISSVLNKKALIDGSFNLKKLKSFLNFNLYLSKHASSKSSKLSSKGGLIFTLFSMIKENIGCEVKLDLKKKELFSENLYDVIFAIDSKKKKEFLRYAKKHKEFSQFEVSEIGKTKKGKFDIKAKDEKTSFGLKDLKKYKIEDLL